MKISTEVSNHISLERYLESQEVKYIVSGSSPFEMVPFHDSD